MEIKAILKHVHPVIEKSSFKSRKVWLTVPDEKYPQTIEIEVQQAKIDLFAGIVSGSPVVVHFNLRGREWTDPQGVVKVFNSLVCWKVESDGTVYSTPQAGTTMAQPAVELPESSDLPF